MHDRRYSISMHFVQVLMNAATRLKLNTNRLLQQVGISQKMLTNPRLRITPDQFSFLMLAVWQQADDEFIGLTTQRCRHGVFTLMAKRVVGARTLSEVYYQLAQFYNLVNESLTLNLAREDDGRACFSMSLARPELDPDYLFRDFFLMLWHRFPSWLVSQRIPLEYITFDFPAPAHRDEYQLMFPCPVRFDASNTSLVFPASVLDMPVVQTPSTLSTYLKRAPLEWFTRQAYYQAYTRVVLDYLERSKDLNLASIGQIAESLHLTERTLRRKLLMEGTSFQQIKDDMRRDRAIHYLSQTAEPISEIARRLGFSEASAFTRAFKLWTGEPPRTYRDAALGKL